MPRPRNISETLGYLKPREDITYRPVAADNSGREWVDRLKADTDQRIKQLESLISDLTRQVGELTTEVAKLKADSLVPPKDELPDAPEETPEVMPEIREAPSPKPKATRKRKAAKPSEGAKDE